MEIGAEAARGRASADRRLNVGNRAMSGPCTRRSLIRAGVTGLAGLTLADMLRAADRAGGDAGRSLIHVHLDGGPPQMDTIDMKPDAPAEVRGEFAPISTAVPGIQVCELLPGIAAVADRIAFVRSVVGSTGQHDAFQCQSGFDAASLRSLGGWPAMGCVLSRLWGRPGDHAPTFVDCMQGRGLARNSARPGFLGAAHAPFRPDLGGMFERKLEEGMQRELAARGTGYSTSLSLAPGLSVRRLGERRTLLESLDTWKRSVADDGGVAAIDRFNEQAVGILTSGRVAEALDLSRESPAVLDRYALRGPAAARGETSDGPEATRKFLLARRLVEAGVRCVSLSLSDFDTHDANFPRMRQLLPILDAGLHGLVRDLEERGLLERVVVVVWGEFGRTPRINGRGGRDHWPAVTPAMLFGGGIRGGQVLGSTDRWAGEVTGGAVSFQDVCATLYHLLGLDPAASLLADPSGRPHPLVETGRVIRPLV